MEHDRLHLVNQYIWDAAQQAAAPRGLSAMLIERFLRTGQKTWEGSGSGRFSLAQFKEDEEYTRATKIGLRNLLIVSQVCYQLKSSRVRPSRQTRLGGESSRW